MKNFTRYEFKRRMIRKKTSLSIVYGLIFLVSTMAFYFVNSSSARNIVDVEIAVTDSDLDLDNYIYQEKVSMEDENTAVILPAIQNTMVVSEYIKISEKDANNIKDFLQNYDENGQVSSIEEPEVVENAENTVDIPEVESTENEDVSTDTEASITTESVEENTNSEDSDEVETTIENNEEIIEENNDNTEEIVAENSDNTDEVIEEKNDNTDDIIEEKNDDIDETIEKSNDIVEETIEESNDIVEQPVDKSDYIVDEGIDNNTNEKTGYLGKAEFINKLIEGKKVLYPGEELSISSDDLNTKTVYLIAKYNKKEIGNQVLYERKLSEITETNLITVSGYMPIEAELKVEEVSVSNVEEQIRNSQDSSQDVDLAVAYDIKILIGEVEYQPEDFGETIEVEITSKEGLSYNVWHIKDDETVEKLDATRDDNNTKVETDSFSIYGLEVVDENSDSDELSDLKENAVDDSKQESSAVRGGPSKAPAPNLPHSTLEIDDYDSDYYYYMGKNYTDNIAGTNANTYSSSNLVKVTLNYYGYAQADAGNNEKIGRISLTETQDHIQNIRCAPVSGGNVTIELMENPFMDKPTGYGFGGWTPSTGTVTQNSQTLTYSVTAAASNNMTINLYANWITARVVYLNPSTGCDNQFSLGYDGSTPEKPLGSWQAACNRLYTLAGNATNREDRESNIIVLTGDIDSSINYTREVTGETRNIGTTTYSQASLISGNTYIISTGTGANSYALAAADNGTSVTREQLLSTAEPSANTQWTITASGNGYTIRNANGRYLSYSGGLVLNNTATVWTYSNNRFRNSNNNRYLRYTNNAWTATNNTSGATISLLTYNFVQTGTELVTTPATSFSRNQYYYTGSGYYNLALTVTSLYNHEDYRQNATMTLTTANYLDFTIYNDFQMDFVKISATGYESNNNGTTFSTTDARLTGRLNNVRIGRGMTCANTNTTGCIFANIIGGGVSSTTSSESYKLIVESGKYSSIQGFNSYNDSYNYYGTVYLVLGSDVDRVSQNNNNMSVYHRTTVNCGNGLNGTQTNDKAFLINVKSGKYGIDRFDANYQNTSTDAYTSGIYLGGYGQGVSTSTSDRSSRYCIVEGGKIANVIGGIKLDPSFVNNVKTRIYVKGGEIYNIVGGAGRSTTYGDRIIQVTGGTVDYSISGGSNGFNASSGDGMIISSNILIYVGGDAQIGTATTLTTALYLVTGGCVLGAGNGSGAVGVGQVDTTHIIINDNAHILNSVYGGGNYGVVGAADTNNGSVQIDILGGTIDRDVYGGSNQNDINGSTEINIKGGQVKGAVYGGSNSSGAITLTSTINVTGGTLGTTGNTNAVLFGGGKGADTIIVEDATVNISDANGTVNIYGNVYGGSAQGRIGGDTVTYSAVSTPTSGRTYLVVNDTHVLAANANGNALVVEELSKSTAPASRMQWLFTSSGSGYTIRNTATNSYLRYSYGSVTLSTTSTTWTRQNNGLYASSRYLRYNNNAWTTTTSYNDTGIGIGFVVYASYSNVADTIVNITDDSSTQSTVNIVGNVFAGGQGTTTQQASITGDSTINVNGSNLPNASIFGGNDVNGTTNGDITVNIGKAPPQTSYTSTIGNVYGAGNIDPTGTEADTVKVYLYPGANVTNAFNGGKNANLTTSGVNDTSRAIYLEGGHADNIFGGSDTGGTVTASHVYINSGTADNVYGGNNVNGQTTESFVYINGGNVTDVYGGGYQATTPTTHVDLSGGTVGKAFGGGKSANVTNANIELDGSTAVAVYGGSNQLGTVTSSIVTITSGTVTEVYGGNNEGGDTVTTNVYINSPATTVFGGGKEAQTSGNTHVYVTSTVENVYGGGNMAITAGDTYVKLTDAIVTDSAFGGGKGQDAVVSGDNTIIVEGLTDITGDLFGGGDAAANGSTENATSTVTTLITGGTIGGDVYGGANTSVVYGDTVVKIGMAAVNDNSLTKESISIGGTVFGGGKSNTAGSSNYDFTFESVTGDVDILIDATGYDNGTYTFDIDKSVFGSGNAAKISGDGYITIKNYGSSSNIKENISIQRATNVTLDNCYIHLEGTTDRTNEIATAIYTFNRIDDLILKNNTTIYLDSGVNITAKLESLDSSGVKELVQIGQNGITSQSVNNRIYLAQGKNIILKTEDGNNGEVKGMAFVGLYKNTITNTGIYGSSYVDGATIPSAVREIFERNSYVQGKHYTSHNIEVDGFYTNYDENGVVDTRFIEPTPEDADYYQWIAGKITSDIYYDDIELIATKYATTASYVLSLDGLSFPNTVVKVIAVDASDLDPSVTLNDPISIPKIAATAQDADTKFGLTMNAGTTGWQTRGTTNYINNSQTTNGITGTTEYLSDNSTTTPTFSFYMDHSKNISSTGVLGNVTIQLEVSYVDANEEMQIRNAYIIIKLTTNNTVQGQDYYEGAISPGVHYSVFPTITTNITDKSTFSAYYSLYIGNYSQTSYYYDPLIPGYSGMYYHDIMTTCVLPENTKITLIDTTNTQYRYYYYIVTASDENLNRTVFEFTDFKCMDSTQEPYSADGSYYNSTLDLFYEEFIVQVNFEDTNIENSLVSKRIFMELRDSFDDTVAITVNSAQFPMLFSVYEDIPVTSSLDLTLNKAVIYMGESLNLQIETEYEYNRNENLDIVYDTTHIENQLGARITISTGTDILTAQNLEGIYIRYRNKNYYARSDGSYRIKLADAVTNVLADMVLYTSNGSLATGTYQITAQTFGSVDGIYFSTPIDTDSKQVQIVNTNYGFKVDMNANDVLIDSETGITKNNANTITFTIGYSGYFPSAEVRVSLYRRDYTDVTSYDYNLVNLADYVTTTLTNTVTPNEYLVSSSLQLSQTYTITLDEGLTTGTYKVRFTLYDNGIFIDNIDKSIIIK